MLTAAVSAPPWEKKKDLSQKQTPWKDKAQ